MAIALPSTAGSLESYIQAVNRFPLLTEEEEIRFAREYRDHEDLNAARELSAMIDRQLKRRPFLFFLPFFLLPIFRNSWSTLARSFTLGVEVEVVPGRVTVAE